MNENINLYNKNPTEKIACVIHTLSTKTEADGCYLMK